ncbi:IucA/IucC family protein [Acinetobacter baumannii]
MQELANRLAIQNFVNAYMQETGKGYLLSFDQQSSTQQAFSSGLTLLTLPLPSIQAECSVPLSYVSRVGRHRLAALPKMCIDGQWQKISAGTIVSLLLEELVIESQFKLDAASLLEKWIQSRDALLQFLKQRHNDFDDLVKAGQNFIESEQALILGHSMHPAPKSRNGFVHEDWLSFHLNMLEKPSYIIGLFIRIILLKVVQLSSQFQIKLKMQSVGICPKAILSLLKTHVVFKLLPLHPWQARYLQGKPWFEQLKQTGQLIDIGLRGWQFSPTTSIRTLANFNAPWMVKTSLSVMITNSIRVLEFGKRVSSWRISYRLWHSDLGKKILKQCPTLKAVNDPAWIALQIDGEIINETICIFRDQPFAVQQQVTCIASLCQDHPNKGYRFMVLFDQIAQKNQQTNFKEIALDWFDHFLKIGLAPLMYVYHKYGMAFESHQQNVLLELEDGLPRKSLVTWTTKAFIILKSLQLKLKKHYQIY